MVQFSQMLEDKMKILTEVSKKITLFTSGGEHRIVLNLSPEEISIKSYLGRDFDFENLPTKETLEKWKAVVKLIARAIKIAEGEI